MCKLHYVTVATEVQHVGDVAYHEATNSRSENLVTSEDSAYRIIADFNITRTLKAKLPGKYNSKHNLVNTI